MDLHSRFVRFFYAHGPLMQAVILEQMIQRLNKQDVKSIMDDVKKDKGTGKVCFPGKIGQKRD